MNEFIRSEEDQKEDQGLFDLWMKGESERIFRAV